MANIAVKSGSQIDEVFLLPFVAGHAIGFAVDRNRNLSHMRSTCPALRGWSPSPSPIAATPLG